MGRLLLVDDDAAFRRVYRGLLQRAGFEVVEAQDREQARKIFLGDEGASVDVVVLDLMLPPDGSVQEGLRQLELFLEARPGAKIVVASGAGDNKFMIEAVQQGAYDFLTKPIDPDVLLIVVQRALQRAKLEHRVERLHNSLAQARPGDTMIGQSPAFSNAVEMASRVAASALPVLVAGENGTGKELMARKIHAESPRASRSFVAVNCGALPENLLESALFGHKRGAFTGAIEDRAGLFVEADGGTLFLDELGEMPPPLQVKLLRVLETGDILPVGADRSRHVDVRLVSATNRDLQEMMSTGEFREDLYWRINGATITLPPLRDRPSDIPLLAAHFLNQASSLSVEGQRKQLGEDAQAVMLQHAWPGNLRELRHEMQRATVLIGDRQTIEPEDLAFVQQGKASASAIVDEDASLQEKVEALERREIERVLTEQHNNRSRAAEVLGLSRQGLLNKIKRYGLG